MKMLTLVSVLLFANLAQARAGVETGNGGAAVVCRNDAGVIVQADLLDLYEGFALYGHGFTERPESPAEQALARVPTLNSILGHDANMGGRLVSIIGRLRLLPDGVALEPVTDLGNFIVPKHCKIEQAINYREDGEIFVDSEIWNRFSQTQKSAAYLHEAVYEYARQAGQESDSFRVRQFVSLVYSDKSIPSVIPSALGKHLVCRAGTSEFLLARASDGRMAVYFTKILGRVALDRVEGLSEPGLFRSMDRPYSQLTFETNVSSLIDRGLRIRIDWSDAASKLTLIRGRMTSVEKVSCNK